jgi:GDP-4-dehydro-6-deoxy-D-mannose reductase
MKFLITGINGFVGPYLARLLVALGHEVSGLCRRVPKSMIFGVQYITGDIQHIDPMSKAKMRGLNFDGVFHLAGLTHPPTSFKEPIEYFKTNALGTVNLCEVFTDSIFMQCSTPEVYGICPEEEIFETQPLNPMNPYGVSKAAADLYLLERTRNGHQRAFITRAGSHTGAGRPSCYSISSDAIQIVWIKKGLQAPVIKVGNLSSQRAVIDVRDVVLTYYLLMMGYINGAYGTENGSIFHISGHNVHTMDWYLDLMLDIAKVKVEKVVDQNLVRPIDIPIQILNSDKVRNVINWEPKIPIEATLKGLLDYWMEAI